MLKGVAFIEGDGRDGKVHLVLPDEHFRVRLPALSARSSTSIWTSASTFASASNTSGGSSKPGRAARTRASPSTCTSTSSARTPRARSASSRTCAWPGGHPRATTLFEVVQLLELAALEVVRVALERDHVLAELRVLHEALLVEELVDLLAKQIDRDRRVDRGPCRRGPLCQCGLRQRPLET
jgi:hypothetical protein